MVNRSRLMALQEALPHLRVSIASAACNGGIRQELRYIPSLCHQCIRSPTACTCPPPAQPESAAPQSSEEPPAK